MAQSRSVLQQCGEIMESYNLSTIERENDMPSKLREGLLIDGNKYFRFDGNARLCVDLYAKALSIAWGGTSQYWTYDQEKILDTGYTVDIAKLLSVCWFNVEGEFDMRLLTVGTKYEIFFDVELTPDARGWGSPVTFEHMNPFGEMNKVEENFHNRIGPIQILMGTFRVPFMPASVPCSTFKMFLHSGNWKGGLIVRRVCIKPAS